MPNANTVKNSTQKPTPTEDIVPKRAGTKQLSKKKGTKKSQSSKLRYDLAQNRSFKGKCYICGKKYKQGAYFVFHHLWYERDEKIYSDFTTGDAYTTYVIEKIRKNPSRFLLLCRGHHSAVEHLVRYREDTRRRLYAAVRHTLNGKKRL